MSQPEQLFCPNCRGGNSPQALMCQWCGKPLRAGAPIQYQPPPQQEVIQQKRRGACAPLLIGALVLGVILVFAVGLSGNKPSNTTTGVSNTVTSNEPPKAMPGIGDTVNVGDWEVTVDKVESAKEIEWSGFGNKEAAKGKFILVYVNVRNVSNKTSSVNSFDYQIADSADARYKAWTEFAYFAYAGNLKMTKFNEEIPPRSSSKLLAMFDVAEDAKDLILGIEAKQAIFLGTP